jgi:hypothetical protein
MIAMFKRLIVISGAAALVAPTAGNSHAVEPSQFLTTERPYAPYEFLIGNWSSRLESDKMSIRQQFKWGPNRSYITYATYMTADGHPEELHFEGMMVWNGKSKALDFLFAVAPGSGAEEKGTISAQADGSVVRDVELTDAAGKGGRFRQSFRRSADGTIVTSITRKTANGWETSPPGEIVMARRP